MPFWLDLRRSALAYPVAGCNMPTASLKGKIVYRSNSTFSDPKIGDTGLSTKNGNGASTTSFTRCQFRGGGGSDYNAAVVLLGLVDSCDRISFKGCNVERNLGVENATCAFGLHNISINEIGQLGGAHIE